MKVTKFIVGVVLVAVIVGVIRGLCPLSPVDTPWWQPVVSLVWIVSPLLLVMLAEPVDLKALWREYLSFKNVRWGCGFTMLATAAVLGTALMILLAALGDALGIDCFGRLMSSGKFDCGLFSADMSTMGGRMAVIGYSIMTAFVLGAFGLINHICGEVGLRGFMQKYLPMVDALKPLVVGLVWTLWMLPSLAGTEVGVSMIFGIAMLAVKYVVLSYLLAEVLKRTGSVWFTAAIFGVVEGAVFCAFVSASSEWSMVIVAVALLVVFKYAIRRLS